MKKKFKVLLIMLGLIMPFMANNVYAEETATNSSETTTDEATVEEEKSITIADLISYLPEVIQADFKESEAFDMVWFDEEHTRGWSKIDDVLNNYTSDTKDIFNKLDTNGDKKITFVDGEDKYDIDGFAINFSNSNDDFHKINAEINFMYKVQNGQNLSYYNKNINIKEIPIVFTNTKDYNEETAKEVQAKLAKIDLNSIIATEINSENFPTNDEESEEYIKKVVENGFNDDKVKVVVYGGLGSDMYNIGFARQSVLIIKNDVVYAKTWFNSFYMPQLTIPANISEDEYADYAIPFIKKYVEDSKYYTGEITSFEKVDDFRKLLMDKIPTFDIGYNNIENVYKVKFANTEDEFIIHLKQEGVKSVVKSVYFDEIDGVDLSGTTIDEETPVYSAMKDFIQEKGYKNIFGAFELKVVAGDITGGLTLTFNVGREHNGKQAFVLHQKHDGSYEEFTGIVENGVIKITVNELSPFMVALGDVVEEESTEPVSTTNNAGTGTTNIFLCGAVALSAMGGMIYLKKNKQN